MIKSLINAITGVVLALVKDLLPAIKRLFELLCRAIHAFFHRERGKHKVNPSQCIPVRHPSFRKPDPLIYDQYYLMSLGLAVTWQNPDIQILEGGVPVAPDDLQPSTAYTVRARIWNGSTTGVCAGMPVTFSYLSFGVGTVSHFIGTTSVNLGVKGSAQCPVFADMVWITPPVAGHYCIQVSFFWIDGANPYNNLDGANPYNNLGQENTQVVKAASPADFTFTLRNPGSARREYRFEVDTFQLETPPPCPDKGRAARCGNSERRSYSGCECAATGTGAQFPRRQPAARGLEHSSRRPNVQCAMMGEPLSSGFFQQAGNPDQNHRTHKRHNDGTDHAAALPDSQHAEDPAAQ